MLSMFLMSFLGSALGSTLGSVLITVSGLVLRSREVLEGEAQLGGDTGGEQAEVTDFGVRDLKAEGPEEEVGEVIEVLREAGDLEYGENLCCLSLSASMELATEPAIPG